MRALLIAAALVAPGCAAGAPDASAPDLDGRLLVPGDPYLSRAAESWLMYGDDARLKRLEAAAEAATAGCAAPDWRRNYTAEACEELRAFDAKVTAIRSSSSPLQLRAKLRR